MGKKFVSPMLAACVLCVAAIAVLLPQTTASSSAPDGQLGDRRRCTRYSGIPEGFEQDATAGMVFVQGGTLELGSTQGYPEERGGSSVQVEGFWIDRTEVTNAQFARFVAATRYVTDAERRGRAPVFHVPTPRELEQRGSYAWWTDVEGANWRHPEGPKSSIGSRANHPVVHVTHADALAYARWLGRSLPSEAQWEFAAKAGRSDDGLHHAPRNARGSPLANFWQGDFPTRNSKEDGFVTSAPVGCYEANGFGLYDALGNVWEWTGSRFTSSHRNEARDVDPQATSAAGPDVACQAPARPGMRLVLKGGSYLCAANFCARYRVSARHAQEVEQGAMHIGFRTVLTRS